MQVIQEVLEDDPSDDSLLGDLLEIPPRNLEVSVYQRQLERR